RSPRSCTEVLRLLGLIQYPANFLPDVAHYTSPLEGICRGGQPFVWRAFHQLCLNRTTGIVRKTHILRPINPNNPDLGRASIVGIEQVTYEGPNVHFNRPQKISVISDFPQYK
ncbi:hypothetical protein B0H13DRAFT_1646996, partial [Mycena leptocephala]